MSPSTPVAVPMIMAILVLLDIELDAGITGGVPRVVVQFPGEDPVQRRSEGVYVNLYFVLLNKLCGTYPVKLLPSTNLHIGSEHVGSRFKCHFNALKTSIVYKNPNSQQFATIRAGCFSFTICKI